MWNFLKPAPHKDLLPEGKIDSTYKSLRWQVFVGIFIGYAGYYIVRKNFSMAMPFLTDPAGPYGFDKGSLSIVLSLNAVAYALSKFLMGSVSDRSNARVFLPLGLVLAALSMMFMAVPIELFGASTTSIVIMAVLNFLVGWFNGMGWPPCGRVMTLWFSVKERGKCQIQVYRTTSEVIISLHRLNIGRSLLCSLIEVTVIIQFYQQTKIQQAIRSAVVTISGNQVFSLFQGRYERQEDYDRLLQWFHYESYILPESARELSDFAHDRWKEQPDLNQEQLNNLLVNSHGMMAYTSKTSLLGLTSPQWLAKILPAEHPDHAVFQNTADESVATLPDDMLEENRQQYETFRKAAGDKLLLYFDKTEDAQTFITETSGLIPAENFHLPEDWQGKKLAIYATPEEGAQVITRDVELIKDENNPFYDANRAAKQALSFFIVKHCRVYFLPELVKRGMLADAQTKSLISPERGKAIIQENWKFLARYFIREYPNR